MLRKMQTLRFRAKHGIFHQSIRWIMWPPIGWQLGHLLLQYSAPKRGHVINQLWPSYQLNILVQHAKQRPEKAPKQTKNEGQQVEKIAFMNFKLVLFLYFSYVIVSFFLLLTLCLSSFSHFLFLLLLLSTLLAPLGCIYCYSSLSYSLFFLRGGLVLVFVFCTCLTTLLFLCWC